MVMVIVISVVLVVIDGCHYHICYHYSIFCYHYILLYFLSKGESKGVLGTTHQLWEQVHVYIITLSDYFSKWPEAATCTPIEISIRCSKISVRQHFAGMGGQKLTQHTTDSRRIYRVISLN